MAAGGIVSGDASGILGIGMNFGLSEGLIDSGSGIGRNIAEERKALDAISAPCLKNCNSLDSIIHTHQKASLGFDDGNLEAIAYDEIKNDIGNRSDIGYFYVLDIPYGKAQKDVPDRPDFAANLFSLELQTGLYASNVQEEAITERQTKIDKSSSGINYTIPIRVHAQDNHSKIGDYDGSWHGYFDQSQNSNLSKNSQIDGCFFVNTESAPDNPDVNLPERGMTLHALAGLAGPKIEGSYDRSIEYDTDAAENYGSGQMLKINTINAPIDFIFSKNEYDLDGNSPEDGYNRAKDHPKASEARSYAVANSSNIAKEHRLESRLQISKNGQRTGFQPDKEWELRYAEDNGFSNPQIKIDTGNRSAKSRDYEFLMGRSGEINRKSEDKKHPYHENNKKEISKCYAADDKYFSQALAYLQEREGMQHNKNLMERLYDESGYNDGKHGLKAYLENGSAVDGFYKVTDITVKGGLEGYHDIPATVYGVERNGESVSYSTKKNNALAQLDIGLREQGYTPVWALMSYIDTENGEKREGIYLAGISETQAEAEMLLMPSDEYGMRTMGLITMVNGIEPGEGTMSLEDIYVSSGDSISPIYKHDMARYSISSKGGAEDGDDADIHDEIGEAEGAAGESAEGTE